MSNIQVGSYVTYKGRVFIVTELRGSLVLIISEDNKLQVSQKSLTLITSFRPAKIVSYRDANYLVTTKGLIISLTTNKIMKWNETDGNRIAILNELNQKQIGI